MKSVSSFKRMAGEKYMTPVSLTRAFLKAEPFAHGVWDPAAGAGHILDALHAEGINCVGTDIAPDRADVRQVDFFRFEAVPAAVTSILTNPPYGLQGKLAEQFIRHALELMRPVSGKVAMLVHEDFDCGKTRRPLFDDHPAFVAKVVLTDRVYWANLPQTERSSTNHAWLIWDWSPARAYGGAALRYLHAPDGVSGWR